MFPRAARLISSMDNMLESIRESNLSLLRETFRENYSKAIRRAAHDRLASLPQGPYKKPRVLHEWIDGAGRTSSFSTYHFGLLMSPFCLVAQALRASCSSCVL